ncbi:MAG: carbohydrate binding family 9 domain-containing protein [Holophagales bacterium]|nr:carbohydrate binding family 9 domain-containing protein [Holophagales bacterium]
MSFLSPARRALLPLLALLLCSSGLAQRPEEPLLAVVASREVVLDGRLGDPLWKDAPVLDRFTQQAPDEGAPATERTEVRVVVTPRALVVGVVCFDREAGAVAARQYDRDGDFASDDWVNVSVDSYLDRRNASFFRVNPLGTQYDSIVTNEGTEEAEWDAIWESRSSVGPDGWRAEIAIPLSSLRYPAGATSFGFNVTRMLRRRQESSSWGAWRREAGPARISMSGMLTGFRLERRLPLVVKPYLLTGYDREVREAGGTYRSGARFDAGLDVKAGVTPTLVLDATYRTDFAQVESDTQRVNLSRFPLFYPEKRDFFLERMGFTRFGQQEMAELFYSRRIGLSPDGEPVPIVGGARLTGNVGRTEVGVIAVRQEESAGLPETDFYVARVRHPLGTRSSVGAIFTDREGGPPGKEWNRAGGFDLDLKPTETLGFTAFWATTRDAEGRPDTDAWRVTGTFDDGTWQLHSSLKRYDEDFDPGIGFVAQTGITNLYGRALRRFFPKAGLVREWDLEAEYDYFEDPSGAPSMRRFEAKVSAEARDASWAEAEVVADSWDRLDEPFEIREGIVVPAGAFWNRRHAVEAGSSRANPFFASGGVEWGTFYGGNLETWSGQLSWRPNPHLLVDLTEEYNDVHLPAGSFTTSLLGLRGTWNFSRSLLLSAFAQANTDSDLTSVNTRLRWMWRPGSDVYLVFNRATGEGLEREAWQVMLKATWAILP